MCFILSSFSLPIRGSIQRAVRRTSDVGVLSLPQVVKCFADPLQTPCTSLSRRLLACLFFWRFTSPLPVITARVCIYCVSSKLSNSPCLHMFTPWLAAQFPKSVLSLILRSLQCATHPPARIGSVSFPLGPRTFTRSL